MIESKNSDYSISMTTLDPTIQDLELIWERVFHCTMNDSFIERIHKKRNMQSHE